MRKKNPVKMIRHLFYAFCEGIENLVFWIPAIWKDRDFDHHFMFIILNKKLIKMEKFYRSKHTWSADALKYADQIKIARILTERIVKDKYVENALIPYDRIYGDVELFDSIPTSIIEGKPKLYSIVEVGTKQQHSMFRRAGKHSDYMEKQDIEYLFKFLKKHIQNWWD
jgi:hypothetical protein